MNRSLILLFTLLFFQTILIAQQSFDKVLADLKNASTMKHAGLSVTVVDVTSNKVIKSHNEDLLLTPASSLKVVTTACALQVLGPEFQFKTELQYDGSLDANGVLNGNLYIKGYGDPTLGSHHFEKVKNLEEVMNEFVNAIRREGIKKVNGKIVGDASYFGSAVNGRSWLWEDLGNYYAAGAWGLNIHENLHFLELQQVPGLGSQPKFNKINPYIPNLLFINELRSAGKGSGDQAYIFGAPYTYTRFIRGTIPIGNGPFTIKGSIPDPPFFAAYTLMDYLEKNGIETAKDATSLLELDRVVGENAKGKTYHTFYTFKSPPLSDIVKVTNLKSVNLYCESMLRAMGMKVKKEGTAAAGLEVINDFLVKNEIDNTAFFMADASGLSMRNAVSSKQMAQFMTAILKDKNIASIFESSLPKAGETGTLKGMFKNTVAVGKLKAKSGGMTRVSSYTGYATTKSGKRVAFSMLANNFTGKSSAIRNKMEQLMIAICELE